jgi:hypothetical protein
VDIIVEPQYIWILRTSHLKRSLQCAARSFESVRELHTRKDSIRDAHVAPSATCERERFVQSSSDPAFSNHDRVQELDISQFKVLEADLGEVEFVEFHIVELAIDELHVLEIALTDGDFAKVAVIQLHVLKVHSVDTDLCKSIFGDVEVAELAPVQLSSFGFTVADSSVAGICMLVALDHEQGAFDVLE